MNDQMLTRRALQYIDREHKARNKRKFCRVKKFEVVSFLVLRTVYDGNKNVAGLGSEFEFFMSDDACQIVCQQKPPSYEDSSCWQTSFSATTAKPIEMHRDY